MKQLALLWLVGLLMTGCKKETNMIAVSDFGVLTSGETAKRYILTNDNGMKVSITEFGATLVSVEVPDRDGELADVTLGFDAVDGYSSNKNPYFGSSVGRFGNRIAHGKFSLDGKEYTLATNNQPGGDSLPSPRREERLSSKALGRQSGFGDQLCDLYLCLRRWGRGVPGKTYCEGDLHPNR